MKGCNINDMNNSPLAIQNMIRTQHFCHTKTLTINYLKRMTTMEDSGGLSANKPSAILQTSRGMHLHTDSAIHSVSIYHRGYFRPKFTTMPLGSRKRKATSCILSERPQVLELLDKYTCLSHSRQQFCTTANTRDQFSTTTNTRDQLGK